MLIPALPRQPTVFMKFFCSHTSAEVRYTEVNYQWQLAPEFWNCRVLCWAVGVHLVISCLLFVEHRSSPGRCQLLFSWVFFFAIILVVLCPKQKERTRCWLSQIKFVNILTRSSDTADEWPVTLRLHRSRSDAYFLWYLWGCLTTPSLSDSHHTQRSEGKFLTNLSWVVKPENWHTPERQLKLVVWGGEASSKRVYVSSSLILNGSRFEQ